MRVFPQIGAQPAANDSSLMGRKSLMGRWSRVERETDDGVEVRGMKVPHFEYVGYLAVNARQAIFAIRVLHVNVVNTGEHKQLSKSHT